jgi:Glycerophosphoryl diester phosphodiesterase family
MSGKFLTVAGVILVVAAGVWLNNTSILHGPQASGKLRVLAHRGVHQTFPTESLDNDSCTATLITPPRHGFLENTIASMRAAFDSGADVVELDVHLTPDGKLAVFHDWTLECRTDGKGVTEQTPFAVLKTLDIGYGYSADGGTSFPFRGRGKGLMPELTEVFDAFADRKFLVDYKSRRAEEGAALAALLAARPEFRDSLFGVYGGTEPTRAAIVEVPWSARLRPRVAEGVHHPLRGARLERLCPVGMPQRDPGIARQRCALDVGLAAPLRRAHAGGRDRGHPARPLERRCECRHRRRRAGRPGAGELRRPRLDESV